MKLRIAFHPLQFQASLAAGGVALMAFNYLQFAIPHQDGLITLSNIRWDTLTGDQRWIGIPLIAILLAFTLVHFLLTAFFTWRLPSWFTVPAGYRGFMADPYKNVGIFPIVASLSMTANVFWGPLGFFVPQVSSNLQALMLPSLVFFGLLWLLLFFLEFKVVKTWLAGEVDKTKFNFVWLLDAFAFGLVSLTGSGVVAITTNRTIAVLAVVGTIMTLIVGLSLLLYKLVRLATHHIRAGKLPDNPVLPAFFLVVPIACLFGLSIYRLAKYAQPYVAFDLGATQSVVVVASYAITIVWGMAAVYLIRGYFKSYFVKSQFAPTQWGFV